MHHPKHVRPARIGCLKLAVILFLVLIAVIAGTVVLLQALPARVSQRVPTPVETTSASPDPQPTADDTIHIESQPLVEWSVNEALPTDEWINILLLGTDAGDPDQPGRTDAMLIASVNGVSGQIKLTSIMRDTYVPIAGHGKNKITTANWFGGVDLTLRTVNEAFDMNITHYAMVDFSSFAYIVDAMGGIDLPVTKAEMRSMNDLMQDMRVLYPNIDLPKLDLTEYGESVHLDGMQTLAFSRIRKLDSDYQRTNRQRMVINAILQKLRTTRDLKTLYELFDIALGHTRTSLTTLDITRLALKVIGNGLEFKELRLPAEGAYKITTQKGMDVLDPDLDKNVEILHQFIYGTSATE